MNIYLGLFSVALAGPPPVTFHLRIVFIDILLHAAIDVHTTIAPNQRALREPSSTPRLIVTHRHLIAS